MTDRGRFGEFLRRTIRHAGRQYAASRRAYAAGKRETSAGLPTDDEGRTRIVCRRYAEQRAVAIDDRGRPSCFDPDHQDCQGCVEDVRAGRIETW